LKSFILSNLLLFAAAFSLFPQAWPSAQVNATAPQEQPGGMLSSINEAEERLKLAISSLDYPVTPGDIYQLSYRESAGALVSRQFQVDSVSTLDLGVFGKISTSNMLFNELKREVEDLISKNYTYSTPSLSIISPGVFRVAVKDETTRIQYVTAWGLSRISEVVTMASIQGVSIRDVERIFRDGNAAQYDLLKGADASPKGGDPLVRPGDIIILHQAERTVELRGEVRHPGLFELIDSEGIKDLIEVFGGGFTRRADLNRLRIIHSTNTGERIEYISLGQGYDSMPKLNDGDTVVIGDKTAIRSLVWFEGAVVAPPQERENEATGGERDEAAAQLAGNGRFYHYISEGVRLSDVLEEVQASILHSADLGSVFVTIPGDAKPTVLDARPLLYRSDLSSDIVLAPNTRIFIPEYKSRISVAGAVIAPGFVPYLPGAPANYYVSLCGGFNPERNWGGALTVCDQFGHRRRKSQAIMPGDSIFVKNNNPGYNLERSLPVIASVLTTVISIATFAAASGLIDFAP
jgi:protein involved in polysaccharide export with SLBB domain